MPRLAFFRWWFVAAVLTVTAASCATIPLLQLPPADPLRPWVPCEDRESPAEVTRTLTGGTAATLTLPRGHRLDVPPTAIPRGSQVTVIFRQLPVREVAVQLLPDHHRFQDTLTLTLHYSGRDCDVRTGTGLTIFRVNPNYPHNALPPSAGPGIPTDSTVRASLNNFSVYAIAR